jgi:hypothetical protein
MSASRFADFRHRSRGLHPEYPSQATINATIASAVLESVFGALKAIPFTATDVRDPKRTRQLGRKLLHRMCRILALTAVQRCPLLCRLVG